MYPLNLSVNLAPSLNRNPYRHTVTSAKEDGKYSWYLNKPYNSAIFIVSIAEIGDVEYIDAFGTREYQHPHHNCHLDFSSIYAQYQ